MTNYLIGFVIVLMIVLIIVVASFALLDRMLKGGAKKVTEKSSASKKAPAEIPTEEPAAVTKTPPMMNIYNSELADDLNAMLKDSDQNPSARLQIENHINKESNIAKYLQNKNYKGFKFDDEDTVSDDTEQPLTFTREDYKRIVALSNIDDKKPL